MPTLDRAALWPSLAWRAAGLGRPVASRLDSSQVAWLISLHQNGMSGILADQMVRPEFHVPFYRVFGELTCALCAGTGQDASDDRLPVAPAVQWDERALPGGRPTVDPAKLGSRGRQQE